MLKFTEFISGLEWLLSIKNLFLLQICSISHFLKSSALNIDCTADDLTALLNVEEKHRRLILDRSGQFENSGENLNICSVHFTALIDNIQKHEDCMAENHDKTKSRRLRGNDLKNAEKISEPLSKHILKSNGFLLPVGAKICSKCRYELSISNPLPKKQKLESENNVLPKKKKPESEIIVCSTGDTIVTRQKSRLQLRQGPL